MRGYMFKSSKGAILFVVVTIFGAAMLIGSENNEGALIKAAADIEKQREMINAERSFARSENAPVGFASGNTQPLEFTPDEDLIDDATGFDPTPEPQLPLVSAEPQVSLVESRAEIVIE